MSSVSFVWTWGTRKLNMWLSKSIVVSFKMLLIFTRSWALTVSQGSVDSSCRKVFFAAPTLASFFLHLCSCVDGDGVCDLDDFQCSVFSSSSCSTAILVQWKQNIVSLWTIFLSWSLSFSFWWCWHLLNVLLCTTILPIKVSFIFRGDRTNDMIKDGISHSRHITDG